MTNSRLDGTDRGSSGSAVVIAVLTWRGERVTRACLESLRQLRGGPYPTLVVDNASGTGEADRLALEFGPPVEALTRSVNDGVAGGYNAALAWGASRGASHVLLLNNDIEILDPEMVSKLVAAATSLPNVAAAGPLVYDPDRTLYSAGGVLDRATGRSDHLKAPRFEDRAYEVEWLDGPALLVSVDAVRRIGGLSPAYFMYWEDVDWSVRAAAAGFRCLVQPTTSILHQRGARASGLHLRLQWRNRVLFMRRNASRRDNATSLAWMVSLSAPKAILRSCRSSNTTLPLLSSIARALGWNARDAIRHRRWFLESDGPVVLTGRSEMGRSIAIVIDDLAAAVVASRNPAGIQRVVAGLVDTAAARVGIRSWPAVTAGSSNVDEGVRLLQVDPASLPWRRQTHPASGRRRLLRAARRMGRSLPLPAPFLRGAKAVYGRVAVGVAGLDATPARDSEPDLLVVAGGFWSGGAATRVRRLAAARAVPVSLLVHDLFPLTHPEWYPADLRRDFAEALNELVPVVRRVGVMSEAVARDVRERLPALADSVRVGTPTLAAHRPLAAADVLTTPPLVREPFVLVLGTVEPRKNHALILRAWDIVRRDGALAGARLVIAGRLGWLSEAVESSIARDAVERGIVRLTDVSDIDAERLFAGCAATVHASWTEGFGLPARESIARGIPTLMSSGIPRDGLTEGRFQVFDPDDPQELARLIEAVLGAPKRRVPIDLGEGTGWEPVLSALID